MRWLLALGLVACGSTRPSRPQPAPADVPAPSRPVLDPAIEQRLAEADIVVRGRAHVGATLSGHIGTIAVDAIIRGAVPMDVPFISAPVHVEEGKPAIYFLRHEGRQYRVLHHDRELGLDVALEPAIIAHAEYTPRAVWASSVDAHRAELDTFRRGAKGPAVAAAAIVFGEVPWIGIPSSVVRDHLGPPDEQTTAAWRYVRHDGEAGQIRVLHFIDDRVSLIEIVRTH